MKKTRCWRIKERGNKEEEEKVQKKKGRVVERDRILEHKLKKTWRTNTRTQNEKEEE